MKYGNRNFAYLYGLYFPKITECEATMPMILIHQLKFSQLQSTAYFLLSSSISRA